MNWMTSGKQRALNSKIGRRNQKQLRGGNIRVVSGANCENSSSKILEGLLRGSSNAARSKGRSQNIVSDVISRDVKMLRFSTRQVIDDNLNEQSVVTSVPAPSTEPTQCVFTPDHIKLYK